MASARQRKLNVNKVHARRESGMGRGEMDGDGNRQLVARSRYAPQSMYSVGQAGCWSAKAVWCIDWGFIRVGDEACSTLQSSNRPCLIFLVKMPNFLAQPAQFIVAPVEERCQKR